MLPEAPGAKGQPPNPARDPSKVVIPISKAARTFARPSPRVLCKWAPPNLSSPISARTALKTRRIPAGSAMPVVSASPTSSTPASTKATDRRTTSSWATGPAMVQPQTVDKPPSIAGRCPSGRLSRRAQIRAISTMLSSGVLFTLARLWGALTEIGTVILSAPAAIAASAPR